MIDFKETTILNLICHKSSIDDEKSLVNITECQFDEEDEDFYKKIFLKPFQSVVATYDFHHSIELSHNTLFKLSEDMEKGASFIQTSKDIHEHLRLVSKHPNIKDGDLFVAKFDSVLFHGEMYNAYGIYKVETKESFIEAEANSLGGVDLRLKKGIGSKKLDKACLVVFTEDNYTVLMIDNGSTETEYWKNDFISVKLKDDHVNETNHLMDVTRSFITEQIPTEYEVNRADQIDLLNRTVDYFKSSENFDQKTFEDKVFKDEELINSFRSFDSRVKENSEVDYSDCFEISPQVVKKQAKYFKSILKLDKNFHIYIHGNRELIEQGKDENGKKFYKVYYDVEH